MPKDELRGWKPPKILDHYGFGTQDPGQPSLPGMPGHSLLPPEGTRPGHPLYHERSNPNVWGSLAGTHHNPFLDGGFGSGYDMDWSWDHHDGLDDGDNYHRFTKMVDRIKHHVSRGTPCIAVDTHVLGSVLHDGRYKSQFESGTSNGMLHEETRAGVEHMHFGYPSEAGREWHETATMMGYDSDSAEPEDGHPPDHPSHARPVYGILAHHPLRNTLAHHYGRHLLVLKKPVVWHRTTACVGDSLNNHMHVRPQPVQAFNEHAIPLRSKWNTDLDEYERNTPERDAAHRIQIHKDHHLDRDRGFGDYTEAQFHGGVSLHDLHYAVLRGGRHEAAVERLKEHLNDKGVPWVHTDHPHSGVPLDVKDHFLRNAVRYQGNLERILGGAMQGKVIAQQGPNRFLIEHPDGTGQIADTSERRLYPPQSVASIAARGYWEPTTSVDLDDVLALVRPAV
jgi:hypothetical protein